MTLSKRRRVVMIAAVVSALAFGVGMILGRSGAGEQPSAAATVATSSPEPLGSTPPPVAGDMLADALVAVESRASTGWTSFDLDVDPRVAAFGIRIVGIRAGHLIELDTATGVLKVAPTETQYDAVPQLDAGADWVLVRRPDLAFSQLFRGTEPPVPIRMGYASEVFNEPGTDRFWRVITPAQSLAPSRVVELDHEGRETGVEFTFGGPGRPIGADPAGGVIVVAPGGVYHAGADGSHRITSGDLVAIGATSALVSECSDDLMACGLFVRDRRSGVSQPLEPALPSGTPDLQIYASGASYGQPSLLSALSPDGRYAPVVVSGSRLRFGVIDLVTGDFLPLGVTPQSGVWWAPDSRSVMYVYNERVRVDDLETRLAYDAVPGLEISAFAVRPAA